MNKTKGKVSGIIANLVEVQVDGPVLQNEICYIHLGEVRLMSEVIKIKGDKAFVQVFESTRGMKIGCEVDFMGQMLEVSLGPGILSKNYDGLQNDLEKMEGVFLKRGIYTNPLDDDKLWDFKVLSKVGDKVRAGAWIGEVAEGWLPHKIMLPFKMKGEYTITWLAPEGPYTILDKVAEVKDEKGNIYPITMLQKWPVKIPITVYKEKPRPF
ncbi:MAG: V-type ATP synthase subunit A, partial [Bacteroidales bacterium]